MKQSKQELKYQARQQLQAKFRPQECSDNNYNYYWSNKVDVTQLLKKVVK